MNRPARSPTFWAWSALGLAGSLLVAVAAPAAVPDSTTPWWYAPSIPGGRGVATTLIYLGMALLCVAWLGLGPRLSLGDRRRLVIVVAAWLLPLALAPALFSRDVYSYLAQGTLLHLGHNPYHVAPQALAGLGHGHALAAVSPFWRRTTAPYGPLFLGLMSLIVSITGSHLVAGLLVTRALDLVAVGLLVVFVPRIARALGASPSRGIWLAALSPLLAFELIAPAHNDVLMIGLLAAGVAVALRGRPVLGVAICALAATVKLPALAGAVFIIVAWARAEPHPRARVRFALEAVAAGLGMLAAVSVVTGLGFSWFTASLFSTPAKVHLAITPATALGWTVADLLRAVGIAVGHRTVAHAFGALTLAITAAVGLWLLWRVRIAKLAPYLGVLLLVAAAGGPAAWPWYFTWGLVLLAGSPGYQDSRLLALGVVVAVFVIKPNGILALPVQSSPAVAIVYALLGWLGWRWYRRSRRHSGVGNASGASAWPDAPGSAGAPAAAAGAGPSGPPSSHQDLTRA